MGEIAASEAFVRTAAFLVIFLAMALFELWSPRLERQEMAGALKSRRWFANLSLVVISSLVLRVIFPAAAVGAAAFAEAKGWGLLRAAGLDGVLGGIVAFVALDFAVWLEHVASHKLPVLWRIHRVHHADTGFDVTTGLRFHPLEILLSMIWKAGVVIALGAPVLAVLVFEIVLNGSSMFSHSNVRISPSVDRWLRKVIVTPDMHRVHHSTDRPETDSNYGFNFSFWDRLFKTYVGQPPKRGHDGMAIGLEQWRDEKPSRLGWLLALPFRSGRDAS
ncbi:sterol desaturase family protein [Mesorhizobium sp. CGMCC 1.15528]|uniref:Sterol desaturase family protein n=1 Tax=Mesorhizobium zhangyense TaxID=1776730 RepID=A0A7C9V9I3_9HYPH|nr:sterol desaturase family protein [Mesorhizobium zhangyense]NGN40167.1 sterol desaturase family protein [Mesorhizobium zhangyense]